MSIILYAVVAIVILLGGALGGGLYLRHSAPSDEDDDADEELEEADAETGGRDVRAALAGLYEAVAGTATKRARLRIAAAVGVTGVVIVAFVGTALLLNGLYAAVAFAVALFIGVSAPLLGVIILKDGFPLGGILATWLAILAQFVLGKGAVVRREDGGYEWHRLVETANGYGVTLDDGTAISIDGDRGDLYRFGGRPLAILEDKGRNVEQYTVREEPPETAEESTREMRAGVDVHHPERLRSDTVLVSLKQLAQPAAGSAGPALARRGREKALEEAGGEQSIGTFWLMIATGGLAVLGFVLGFAALSL